DAGVGTGVARPGDGLGAAHLDGRRHAGSAERVHGGGDGGVAAAGHVRARRCAAWRLARIDEHGVAGGRGPGGGHSADAAEVHAARAVGVLAADAGDAGVAAAGGGAADVGGIGVALRADVGAGRAQAVAGRGLTDPIVAQHHLALRVGAAVAALVGGA